jgi:hypothetical protein
MTQHPECLIITRVMPLVCLVTPRVYGRRGVARCILPSTHTPALITSCTCQTCYMSHIQITTAFHLQVILEKLLRSVPGIGGIWLLVRAKGQHNAAQRVAQALQLELFGPLRKELGQAAFDELVLSRVHVVEGNASGADLGIMQVSAALQQWCSTRGHGRLLCFVITPCLRIAKAWQLASYLLQRDTVRYGACPTCSIQPHTARTWSLSTQALPARLKYCIVLLPDQTHFHLLLQAPELESVRSSVHYIIHAAANTTFDERFDTAVAVNTLGASAMAAFAASCPQLQALVHISTVFVNGQRVGTAYEVPFGLNHSIAAELRGDPATAAVLDVQQEVALALGCRGRSHEHARSLGLKRARLHGWTDTYTFSKALGEMLVQQQCSKVRVIFTWHMARTWHIGTWHIYMAHERALAVKS